MEDGELNSLIEGLSQQGSGSGQLLLTQQNHYVVSNTFISTDTPFPTPTPSPSPSIILRSPAPLPPPASPGPARSPARPNTPQPSMVQYNTSQAQFSSIAPNSNQLVQLFQNQSNSLVGRAQIIQTSTVQTSALKGKQPQQILPKPLPIGAATKQTVTRINPSLSQQSAPMLINQPQQNQTLLLNQMLASSAPMLVQPAGGGVHLMLRPPTPTMQNGPGPNQGKVLLGSPSPQQAPTVLIQQNRQQVVRIMTAHGPMQLQQIQTPNGPQLLAIPANQALSFPPNSVLVQGGAGAIHLQQATQPSIQLQQMQPQQQQQHHPPQQQLQPVKPKKSCAGGGGKRPKPIKSRSDSSTSPTSSREDLSPSHASPKVSARLESLMTSPMSSPPMVSLPSPTQKNVTSSLRQMRPTAFARKQSIEQQVLKDGKGEGGEINKQGQIPPPPVIDNLTATINSVAENFKTPSPDEPMGDVLSGTQNLNLNKRPNLTIFQKKRPEEKTNVYPTIQIPETDSGEENRRSHASTSKKTAPKKKSKKDESKVDLWDLMKSAGIGDEEFEEASPNELAPESLEISADSELLAQLQNSQHLPMPGNLRLAVGEDGRHILIDGGNLLIPDVPSSQQVSQATNLVSSNESGPMLNLTPQALATAQNQLTQLLQDHGTITPADQQLLTQIFTVHPSQGVGSVGNRSGIISQTSTSQQTNSEDVVETETMVVPQVSAIVPHPPKVETVTEYISAPPPGLPPLGPDSLVITNNNGVPTLVASPALLQYLQKHQGIIQFQHDPVTKTLQPSLIIPHPQVYPTAHTPVHQTAQQQIQQQHQQQQHSSTLERTETKSPRVVTPNRDVNKGIHIAETEAGQNLSNAVRNANVISAAQLDSMARMIKNNPNLLQVARDTNSLITYKETCSSLTQAEIADIDRKIQNNKNLLDQSFHMETVKEGGNVAGKENIGLQTLQQLQNLDMNLLKGCQEPPTTNTPNTNSEFQNKFIESIGMANNVTTLVYPAPSAVGMKSSAVNQTPQGTVTTTTAPSKRSRKKKADKTTEVQSQAQPQQIQQPPKRIQNQNPAPPVGHLTFNIKQLTPDQNERLNIALGQRGVTANRVYMGTMTELEKQIIEEEIRKVTGGTLGNTTVKFFPPPSLNDVANKVQTQQVSNVRYFTEEEVDHNVSSAMVINNPNLNQLLDGPVGSQLVSLGNPIHSGNQVVTLGSPPPGSVLVGSNGQVVAYVQQAPGRGVPTLQLSASKQQSLKSVQMQIQAITSKPTKSPSDSANLEKLINDQQKILQSGKLIGTSPHPSQPIQIVSQGQVFQTSYVQAKATCTSTSTSTGVSCGTSTSDMPILSASSPNSGKSSLANNTQLPSIETHHPAPQYTPLYVSPNAAAKHVTKCEKGTSPIQIQMGTQTMQGVEFRGGKMSTGTMTSPNTGKPQAVVAPAVHLQHTEPQLTHSNTWTKQPRPPPSPVITISKTSLIEKQMLTDQAGAVRPDVQTPFLSTSDSVKRLVRYHVMEEKGLSAQDLQAADDMFETTAHHLLDKFHAMKNKYKYLLLMESMRETSTAERIMVDRNFIIEERIELEELREQEKRAEDVGNATNHAPPPPPQLQHVSAPAPTPKTEIPLSEANLLELNDSISESDSLSPFRMDFDDGGLSTPQPDSADINAQVQSAIDSILNLRQSDDQDDRRKRKRLRHGAGGSGGEVSRKRERRRGDAQVHEGEDGDPVLDEAIRSILSS